MRYEYRGVAIHDNISYFIFQINMDTKNLIMTTGLKLTAE